MRSSAVLCVLLVAATLLPEDVAAQVRASAYQTGVCERLVVEPAPAPRLRSRRNNDVSEPKQSPPTALWNPGAIKDCLDTLSETLSTLLEIVGTDDAVNRDAPFPETAQKRLGLASNLTLGEYLINQNAAHRRLSRWAHSYISHRPIYDADATALLRSLQGATKPLNALLDRAGLARPFSASLVTSAVLSAAAQEDTDEKKNSASALLMWESQHLNADSETFELSLRGRIGLQPALTLVQLDTLTDRRGIYQDAFLWDIAARVSLPFIDGRRNSSEYGLYGRVGQIGLLNEGVALLDRGRDSELAIPISNGASSTEWFYEAGFDISVFRGAIEVIHAEGSATSPVFYMSVAWRKDNRFRAAGPIATLTRPEERFTASFIVDALSVVDRRSETESPRTFTLGFGIEHEQAWTKRDSKAGVPPGTKIVLKGDIDILRALRGR